MRKIAFTLLFMTATAFGQYKVESAGAPPSEVAPAIRDALQKDGVKVVGPNGSAVAEIWFQSKAPVGDKTTEDNVTFTNIPHGSLMGVIRFPAQASDRRGQVIKPGVYTMRFSYFPADGAHQGVAPSRDFLLLVPAQGDTDLNAKPTFEQLVKMSDKASGTNHPAILSIWKPDSAQASPELKKEGEDWVLYTSIGDQPIAMIIVGTYTG